MDPSPEFTSIKHFNRVTDIVSRSNPDPKLPWLYVKDFGGKSLKPCLIWTPNPRYYLDVEMWDLIEMDLKSGFVGELFRLTLFLNRDKPFWVRLCKNVPVIVGDGDITYDLKFFYKPYYKFSVALNLYKDFEKNYLKRGLFHFFEVFTNVDDVVPVIEEEYGTPAVEVVDLTADSDDEDDELKLNFNRCESMVIDLTED